MVLVRAALAGCIRMSKIKSRPRPAVNAASLDALDVHELTSAVAGHGSEDSAELVASDFPLNLIKDLHGAFSFGVRHFTYNLAAANLRQKTIRLKLHFLRQGL